jgi:hypothetical protein
MHKHNHFRETKEKLILARETEAKVSAFRCPYHKDRALRAVHPKSHGVVHANVIIECKRLPRECVSF